MDKLEKTTIVFQFEKQQLLDLRRLLFAQGLNPQSFFSYLTDRIAICDPRLEDFFKEAKEYKINRVLERKMDKADADTIYSIIEQQLKNL